MDKPAKRKEKKDPAREDIIKRPVRPSYQHRDPEKEEKERDKIGPAPEQLYQRIGEIGPDQSHGILHLNACLARKDGIERGVTRMIGEKADEKKDRKGQKKDSPDVFYPFMSQNDHTVRPFTGLKMTLSFHFIAYIKTGCNGLNNTISNNNLYEKPFIFPLQSRLFTIIIFQFRVQAEVFMPENREEWKSRVGFILAAVGSAVGLGNIWRFNYMAYSNGGGAFLIPYFFSLFTAGIPLLILEFGLGHRMRGSAPLSFRKIENRWEILGWWPTTYIIIGIELYYTVIIGYCVNYLFYSLSLAWGNDPNTFFFKSFLNVSEGPWSLGAPNLAVIGGLAVVWFSMWVICSRGIQKGIEKACKIFIPLLVILVSILLIRGLTLPGAFEGIKWYVKPDFSVLKNPKVWMDAYSQTFFSLTIAFGVMIAYASYLPKNSDINSSAFITGCINHSFSFFAGFAVFSTLGFMAFQSNQPFDKVVSQGIGLAFVAFPKALNEMPVFAGLFGAIFFLALVIAGLSSAISIIEAFSASMMDKYGVSKKKVINISCIAGFFASTIFTTRGGLYWIDIVDHYILQYGLVIVGFLECLVIGWFVNTGDFRKHLNKTSYLRIGKWWEFCIKILTPCILLTIILYTTVHEIAKSYEGYPRSATIVIGIGWVVVTFVAALLISRTRWKNNL